MKSFLVFALVNSLLAVGYLVVFVIHHLRQFFQKLNLNRKPPAT